MNNLPDSILKFFWGDDLKDLNWEKHKKYITKTILEKGNNQAIRWLINKADKTYIKSVLTEKNIDLKSKNFWNIYLS
jgi:hypothetical protein